MTLDASQRRLIGEVGFVIPRLAARLPSRSECLVQALAAENWLRRRGVPAQLVVGVRKEGAGPLDAHSWLKAGETVVTGGDISAFATLR